MRMDAARHPGGLRSRPLLAGELIYTIQLGRSTAVYKAAEELAELGWAHIALAVFLAEGSPTQFSGLTLHQ